MEKKQEYLFAEKLLVEKARRRTPLSLSDLFKQCFGKRLDIYNPTPIEYLRLIATEVQRLQYDLEVARATLCRLRKEAEAKRQIELL